MNQFKVFGYLGLIPFAALAGLAWQPAWGAVIGLTEHSQIVGHFVRYSSMILAFMAGVLWPILQQPEQQGAQARFAIAITALVFMAGFLAAKLSLLLLAAAFCVLWRTEQQMDVNKRYPFWYQQLRLHLTLVVAACHAVIWLSVQ